MENKEIIDLLDYIIQTGLEEVHIKTDKIEIKTKKSLAIHNVVQQKETNNTSNDLEKYISKNQQKEPDTNSKIKVEDKKSDYVTIKSPMIGTFYRSPNPDSPVFVNEGDIIKKGQIICIIEAMKLFNEIESDFEGKIYKVLVKDGTPVEFDQPLFLLDPK